MTKISRLFIKKLIFEVFDIPIIIFDNIKCPE